MTKFINVTAPEYRCEGMTSMCPSVHRSEDGKILAITGECIVPNSTEEQPSSEEACVQIPTELILASLGVHGLVKAVEKFLKADEEFSLAMINKDNWTFDNIVPEQANKQLTYQELHYALRCFSGESEE